jgi:hypothetical protein
MVVFYFLPSHNCGGVLQFSPLYSTDLDLPPTHEKRMAWFTGDLKLVEGEGQNKYGMDRVAHAVGNRQSPTWGKGEERC